MALHYTSMIPVSLSDYVSNDCDSTYRMTPVKEYDETLPVIEVPAFHTLSTPEMIGKWFEKFLTPASNRLMSVNGTLLGDECGDDDSLVVCEVCRDEIEGPYKRICERNVCIECSEGKGKEMKEKMTCRICSASSLVVEGEWVKIDDKVVCAECVKCVKCVSRMQTLTVRNAEYCALCEEDGEFVSLLRREIPYTAVAGICDRCIHLAKTSDDTVTVSEDDTIGSLMEWIPILFDENRHAVLYNTAKGSPRYHNVAIYIMDDHGRSGIHFLECSLAEAIKELFQVTETYQKKYPNGGEGNWKSQFNSPIPKMARSRGKDYHFG